jgi:F-type H+-transporting ATPase subunit a
LLIFSSFIPIFAANFERIMSFSRIKSLLVVGFGLFAMLFSTALLANETPVVTEGAKQKVSEAAPATEHAAKKEGDFNVTETILEHIKDDHSWHLWGDKSIHLPVILKTTKGLEVFSS